MNETTKILYKCIEARYTKVVWTHKIQEKQADLYTNKSKCVKKHICWFTVLTTGGALSTIYPFPPLVICNNTMDVATYITAVLALFLSYFNLRYGDGLLETKASDNRKYAAKVHSLRNKYESLMYDIMADKLSDEEIINKRGELENEENELYSCVAPYTSSKACKLADKALKIDRESTTDDDEIKAIVPKELLVI